jgi:hypothetical protein
MRNIAYVTGGKPIAVLLQSIILHTHIVVTVLYQHDKLLAFSAHIVSKHSMELRQFPIIIMSFSYLSHIIGMQVDLL